MANPQGALTSGAAVSHFRMNEKPVLTTWDGAQALLRDLHEVPESIAKTHQPLPAVDRQEQVVLDVVESMASPVVAVMQPTFLPWLGFFDLMDKADLFIFLDNVQLSNQSFQTRNALGNRREEYRWLSLPHNRPGNMQERTLDLVKVQDTHNFLRRLRRTIETDFGWNLYSEELWKIVDRSARNGQSVADTNIAMALEFQRLLNVNCDTIRASQLSSVSKRSRLVADLLREVGAKTYLAAPGSRAYLSHDNAHELFSAQVRFNKYDHVGGSVSIRGTKHEAYPSSLDLLLRHGPNIRAFLLAGRRASQEWTAQN